MAHIHDIDICDSIVELANSLTGYSYYEKLADEFFEINDSNIERELGKISIDDLELSISLALTKLHIPVKDLADIFVLADQSNASYNALLSKVASCSERYRQISKSAEI